MEKREELIKLIEEAKIKQVEKLIIIDVARYKKIKISKIISTWKNDNLNTDLGKISKDEFLKYWGKLSYISSSSNVNK